jgi:hypothetical protein
VVAFGSRAMQPAAPRLHATRTSLGTAQAWLPARLAGLGTNDVSATQYHMGAPAPRSSSTASATSSALSSSSARQSGRRLPLLARHAASTPTSAPALALLRVEASALHAYSRSGRHRPVARASAKPSQNAARAATFSPSNCPSPGRRPPAYPEADWPDREGGLARGYRRARGGLFNRGRE